MDNNYYREALKALKYGLSHLDTGSMFYNQDQKLALCYISYFRETIPLDYFNTIAGNDENMAEALFHDNIIMHGMIMSVVILDLYLKLNRGSLLDTLTDSEERLLKMIVHAIEKEDYSLLLGDLKTINEFVEASLEFMEASAYLKVELFKALHFEDIELLKSVCPFFMDEYQKYNIDINEDFILRQISKWINYTKDEEIAIRETAQFLINTFKMDVDIQAALVPIINSNDGSEAVMQAILNEDTDAVAGFVKKYYQAHKDKTRKLV